MAEYNEQNIKFGWLTKAEMLSAIENGKLNAYDVCYLQDTHEQVLISSSLEPIPIKSRVRLYGSTEAAIEDIQNSKQTYAGEIISVRDGEKFIAYTVNQFDDGEWYIAPIYSDKMIDYNNLQNTPFINLDGGVVNPIVLKDLEDGCYKITGHFIIPTGEEITSIVGNIIIVDTEYEAKKIKRITSDNITDFIIHNNGTVLADKYATEKYIDSKGYATEADVDIQMEAFKVAMKQYVEDYVKNTVTLLVQHIVDETLDARYAQTDDIKDLFK